MTPERWKQVENLYHAAIELLPEQRSAFLDEACADDVDLRREVESLVASIEQVGTFIDKPPGDVVAGMLAEDQGHSMLGRTLGHYKLHSLLGAGGMGEVYRARDLRLDRHVAVKILPERLAQDAEALRRFEREAKAVAALSHPNILSIFDFVAEQSLNYAVMELLEGETLRARLARGPLGWREAAEVGSAIAEGLAAAHTKGIIHRDLKPENIFLTTDGGVKILDFGIARIKHVVSPQAETLTTGIETTKQGLVIGTIGYMSPEQARGAKVDSPSDIFSLGCVLYETLSGRRPFTGETATEIIASILRDEPLPLTATVQKVPEALEQTIRHCLEKNPSERYQSARDLAFDLKTTLTGRSIAASMPARRRTRLMVWFSAAIALVALTIAAWFFWRAGRERVIDSIAVLPLANASVDPGGEFLSDGITEAVINSLSQLPQLKRVIARSTASSYKGKDVDPRKVGRELNVLAVLMGKLTQQGDDWIIRAELVDAVDGSRLWGEQYVGKPANVMDVQVEITRQISEKLRIKLTGEDDKRLAKRYTDNTAAYQLYLKGRFYSNQLSIDGLKKGIELMNQAIALDPTYALAYAGLADAYADASSVYLPANEALPKAKAAAERALKLDDSLAEAHTLLAHIKGNYEWSWAESEKEFKRTIELRPGYARAHQAYGLHLMIRGRTDEAIAEMARACDLDPLTNALSATLGWFCYLARRYGDAIERSQQLIKLDPNLAMGHYNLGMIYEEIGKYEESIAAFNQAQRLDPESKFIAALLCRAYALAGKRQQTQRFLSELIQQANQGNLDPVNVGFIYSALGDKDQAFFWLEKAYRIRSENLLFLKVDPKFDSLRSDARYTDLLRRLNLVQ